MSASGTNGPPNLVERRRRPRISYPMPVKIRGGTFRYETVVQDIGAGGICSRLPHKLRTGERLWFLIEFSLVPRTAEQEGRQVPRICARGVVTRVRDLQDGTYQFAAKFTHYLFV